MCPSPPLINIHQQKSHEPQKSLAIIDGKNNSHFLLKKAFEQEDYIVHHIRTSLSLVTTLISKQIDIILLDANTPWLSVHYICKSIKGNRNLKHIKIICICDSSLDNKEYTKIDCFKIIEKPFEIQDVVNVIGTLS